MVGNLNMAHAALLGGYNPAERDSVDPEGFVKLAVDEFQRVLLPVNPAL